MRRKREGASLIYVIITFMFVCMVSSAMLSMVSANYRGRVVENKRIENLYGADSGIDVAYNIIGKTFDAATQYGYFAVKQLQLKSGDTIVSNTKSANYRKYMDLQDDIVALNFDIAVLEENINNLKEDINNIRENNASSEERLKAIKEKNKEIADCQNRIAQKNMFIEEDNKLIDVLLKVEFKRAFNNFIKKSDKIGEDEYIPNKLEESVKKGLYVDKVSGINEDEMQIATVKYIEGSKPSFLIDIERSPESDDIEKKVIGIDIEVGGHYKDVKIDVYNKEEPYTIKVTSTFQSFSSTVMIGENKRAVQVIYTMNVPEYEDIFFKSSTENSYKYRVFDDRVLTVNGDMNVNNIISLDINDNIFVKGRNSENERVYGKYVGGISLANINSSIKFKKDVITRGTFNIQGHVAENNTKSTIVGNLYARNILAGDKTNPIILPDKSYLTIVGDTVIDNDLTVKATDTHIYIKNFYGINDKNIYYDDTLGNKIDNGNSNLNDKSRTSSSIIINGYTGEGKNESSVSISDSAYIMGTAYIATDNDYQTGESVAVKGNYKAYSVPINDNEKFIYDGPLQLLDESDVFKKAKHFYDYWIKDPKFSEIEAKDNIKDGGIRLPLTTYSVGAVVENKDNGDKKVKTIRESNYNTEIENIINKKKAQYASKVYKLSNNEVKSEDEHEFINVYNSLGDDSINVEDIMRIPSDLTQYKYNLLSEKNKNEKAIFNYDSGVTIEIKNSIEDDIEIDDKIIKINAAGGILNAVIASNGNVTIDGNITINGNIVTNRDLNISGYGNVVINNDKEIIERIQTQNLELFYDTFGSTASKGDLVPSNKTEEEILNTQYDLSNFITNRLWKIMR